MNIIGKSECTASQMAKYLIDRNPNAASWALEYAKLYLEEGEAEGVRADGAWIQSCKETGNFKFSGGTAVTFDQNNFCGLGVTRKGLKGHSFETPRLGIRAQIQHLKGYATTVPLVHECIDPRYKYITKGCAPRFEDLAGRWAVPGYNTTLASSLEDAMNKGIGYGFDIIAGINTMKAIKVADTTTTTTTTQSTTSKTLRVYLDPGHYGSTYNRTTTGLNYYESAMTWKLAGYLKAELEQRNVVVALSRNAIGANPALYDRGYGAKGYDLFLSLHSNACGTESVDYPIVYRGYDKTEANDFAQKFANMVATLMGTKQAGKVGTRTGTDGEYYGVLRGARAAGLTHYYIVEHSFHTNKRATQWLMSDDNLKLLAKEEAKFIVDYFVNKKTSAPSVSTVTNSSATSSSTANTYTVVKGDTLSKIGEKTGIAWKTIAELNGIKFPYIVRVGQTLKLSSATTSSASNVTGNYSLIFDANYYASNYADLKKAFGTNKTKLLEHFKAYGMKEGRKACESFDVKVYKDNNADLRKTFGAAGYERYFQHYLEYGYKENRKCV